MGDHWEIGTSWTNHFDWSPVDASDDIRDNGDLTLRFAYESDEGTSVHGRFSGDYFLAVDEDNYTFVPGVGMLGVSRGPFTGEAGLLYEIRGGERLLGARVELEFDPVEISIWGGVQVEDEYEDGGLNQEWGNSVVGGQLRMSGEHYTIAGRYQQEIELDGELDEGLLQVIANSGLGSDWVRIFGTGGIILGPEEGNLSYEGWEATAGLLFTIADNHSISASYSGGDRPSLFEFADVEMPDYTSHRGTLAYSGVFPESRVRMGLSAFADSYGFGIRANVLSEYLRGSVLWRRGHELGEQDVGVLLSSPIQIRDNLLMNLSAALVYQGENEFSDGGLRFGEELRVTWAPFRWLGISPSVEHSFTEDDGHDVRVMIVLFSGFDVSGGPSLPSREGRVASTWSSDGPERVAVGGAARVFGVLMFERTSSNLESGFSHLNHYSEHPDPDPEATEPVPGHIPSMSQVPVTCEMCHSSEGNLIEVSEATLWGSNCDDEGVCEVDAVCGTCHARPDPDAGPESEPDPLNIVDDLSALERVEHPGTMAELECY
jgi:hypothetical protein